MPDSEPVELELEIDLLKFEETFTPRTVHGTLLSITPNSARVRTKDLTPDECDDIADQQCIARLLVDGGGEEMIPIKGLLFWVRHIRERESDPGYADLGFSLRNIGPDEMKAIENLAGIVGEE